MVVTVAIHSAEPRIQIPVLKSLNNVQENYVVFLDVSRLVSWQCLTLDEYRFLPYPFQFIMQ